MKCIRAGKIFYRKMLVCQGWRDGAELQSSGWARKRWPAMKCPLQLMERKTDFLQWSASGSINHSRPASGSGVVDQHMMGFRVFFPYVSIWL